MATEKYSSKSLAIQTIMRPFPSEKWLLEWALLVVLIIFNETFGMAG